MTGVQSLPFASRGLVHTMLGISNGALVAAVCGGEGIAVWTLAASWRAVLLSITEGVLDAGAAPIAAARGRGDAEAERRLTALATMMGVIVASTLAVLGVGILHLSGGVCSTITASITGEISPVGFLGLMVCADAVGTLTDGVRAILLGRGRGGASAVAGSACKAAQLLLGWILIPRIGLLGLLVAHVVSQTTETIIQAAQGWRFLRDVRIADVTRTELIAQLRFGVSAALTDASRNVLYAGVVSGIHAETGDMGVVLHTALVKISNLHFKVLNGVAGGALPEVAEGLAAGRQIRAICAGTLRVLLAWGAAFGVCYLLLPDIFWGTLAPGVPLADAHRAVWIVTLGIPVEAVAMLGGTYLRATRNAMAVLVTEVAGAGVMALGSAAALAYGAGVPGVWAAFVADSLVCACIVGVVIWRKRE